LEKMIGSSANFRWGQNEILAGLGAPLSVAELDEGQGCGTRDERINEFTGAFGLGLDMILKRKMGEFVGHL
jgi:hypothetical protein